MTATTVANKRAVAAGPNDRYIGRPSKWGNPFSHIANGTLAEFIVADRREAVWAYAAWLLEQPELLAALDELRGCRLICWCKPASCHGDVLAFVLEHGVDALRRRVAERNARLAAGPPA
jgi:hypothetical protein